MQLSLVKVIYLKELRDVLRDRRTLFVMIVLPLILYPVLILGMAQIASVQFKRIAAKTTRIVIAGRENAGPLAALLDTLSGVELSDSANWRARVVSADLEAALVIPKGFADSVALQRMPPVSVYYNSSKEVSERARRKLERVLETFRDQIVAARLENLHADTSLLRPFDLRSENLATQQQQQGDVLGKFLGYVLIMMMVAGALYPAIDLTAGEKERGTMETLLVSPAGRADIVYGKFFAVLSIALITALLNLLSLGGTMLYMAYMLGQAVAIPKLAVSPVSLLLSLLLLIPLAVIFSALCLAIAVWARNYKEGQSLLTPVYMAMFLPAMVSLLPSAGMTPALALVPIANVSLLIREYLMGNYLWLESLLAFGSSSLLAAAALWWATYRFQQESVLFRHAEELPWSFSFLRRSPREKPSPAEGLPALRDVLSVPLAVLVILYLLGSRADQFGVVGSLLLSQALILFLPLATWRRRRFDVRRTFALRTPRAAVWPATLIMIIGAWLVGIELASLQNLIWPFPEEFLKRFAELFESLNRLPLLGSLALVALLPGACEELLCRGFLLQSLRPRYGTMAAVVLAALVFGLLHLDPYRLLPTIFLGLLFGLVAVWSGSVYPAMLAHACNNAFSFLVQRYEPSLAGLTWLNLDSLESLPWFVVLLSLLMTAGGLFWLKRIGGNSHSSDSFASSAS